MQLRDYQASQKAAIYDALRDHRRVLAQLPTGGGKSVIIGSICADACTARKRAIVMAHRTELIDQLVRKLNDHGIHPAVVRAGDTPAPRPITVASVQTLARRTPPPADIVIIDEAHHATAESYQTIVAHFPASKILGFTATPVRMGGQGLADAFDVLTLGPTVRQLTDAGHLTEAVVYHAPVREDISTVRSSRGDYNQSDLAQFMERSVIYGDLVESYLTLTPSGKVMLFAASVALSKRYCEEYNEAGIPAAHVDGSTPSAERQRIFNDFAAGHIRVLANVAVATEGVDVPDCDVVQIVRPTKSLSLYLQMVGRGLRPAPGKTHCTILDHAGVVAKHGLPHADREWTLTPSRRRESLPPLVEVPIPDIEAKERKGPEHLTLVKLVPYTPQPTFDPELARLIATVETRNYTNKDGKPDYGWAYRKWREGLTRTPSIEELKAFAKKAGYHHRWVAHQL